jgi:hypothetical protein
MDELKDHPFIKWLLGKKDVSIRKFHSHINDIRKLENEVGRHWLAKRKLLVALSKPGLDNVPVGDIKKVVGSIEPLIKAEIESINKLVEAEDVVLEDLNRLNSQGTAWDWVVDLSTLLERSKLNRDDIVENCLVVMRQMLENELKLIAEARQAIKRKKPVVDFVKKIIKSSIYDHPVMYGNFDQLQWGGFYSMFARHLLISPKSVPGKDLKTVAAAKTIKIQLDAAEKKFVGRMVRIMDKDESRHAYRQLIEDICDEILKRIGAPFENNAQCDEGVAKMMKIINDDKIMFSIVKKLRPSYTDRKIMLVVEAACRTEKLLVEIHENFWT